MRVGDFRRSPRAVAATPFAARALLLLAVASAPAACALLLLAVAAALAPVVAGFCAFPMVAASALLAVASFCFWA